MINASVDVPIQFRGAFIGKGGEHIESLKKQSGCDIKVWPLINPYKIMKENNCNAMKYSLMLVPVISPQPTNLAEGYCYPPFRPSVCPSVCPSVNICDAVVCPRQFGMKPLS